MTVQAAFPARCAVAVVYREQLVSQVYPASVPIETFIDSAVELLGNDLRRRGSAVPQPGGCYELHRANGTRLDPSKTLDDHGVEDGTTLMLVSVEPGESFEPQFEALSTALARTGKDLFPPVTAQTAARTALAILAMVVLTILGLCVYVRLRTSSPASAAAALAVGLAITAGAYTTRRWWPDRDDIFSGFSWLAAVPIAVGLGCIAPGPVGAAHLFIAALAFALFSIVVVALTDRGTLFGAAAVALCALGGTAAALRMWRPVTPQLLGLITLVALLVLLTAAPTIALWAARIRPPHFGSITGRDLFERRIGMAADAVAPVPQEPDNEPDQDSTPRGSCVVTAARRSNAVLTGLCAAAAIALAPAFWAILAPGGPHELATAVLAALFVVIFISRGRAFADRRQAVALVCGAAAAVCVGAVRYVIHDPQNLPAALTWATLILSCFAAAGLAAAVLVPVTRFTPLVRVLTEWVELAAVVTALPLAVWIGGLFTWVRMR